MTDEQVRRDEARAKARGKHAERAEDQAQQITTWSEDQAQWAEAVPEAETVAIDPWKAKLQDIAKAARTFEVGSIRKFGRHEINERYASEAAHLLQVLQARASLRAAHINIGLVVATWALVVATIVLAIKAS